MQHKDKGDGIEDSPLDMLLVILLEGASKEVVWLVTSSSNVGVYDVKGLGFDSYVCHLCVILYSY